MKIKALAVALVLGSSSVAMADSFSFGARASVTASFGNNSGPVVRGPVIRDHRYQDRRVNDRRWNDRYSQYQHPVEKPIFINGVDCQNWDPTNDHLSPCASVYEPMRSFEDPRQGRWAALGSRDSSISDHQYITVQQTFRRIRIEALAGSPLITKVGISFMDGSTQVVQLGAHDCRAGATINLDGGARRINQIVFYTANGSRGVYSVFAL